ncbi:CDP-diacylglycerol--inositol 3-phosphatidyltransferase [Coturnix japonica]|uniref:CDP-diacylglycerol--inositol 3-phosphatidyltransferase n=1 Tax=Coturnix japonica TaxID=93934 RepID=UPI0013A5C91F|nr:CDP-diacylglycerol--inositol 3-phosphatidyltransferase [Coturnix japonica]
MASRDPNVFLFVPNVIGYIRVVLSAVSFLLMPHSPVPAAVCYGLSAALDAVDGLAARWLNQGSRVGAMLDMLTDPRTPLTPQPLTPQPHNPMTPQPHDPMTL